MNKIIKNYTDLRNPAAFTGASRFVENNKQFTLKNVEKELIKHDFYTLHKPIIKKFIRNKTIVNGCNDTWQIDLIDVKNLKNKSFSQYFTFLFTCIDAFSRKAFVIPIKNKSAEETTRAFNEILIKNKQKPVNIYSDNGKEFLGLFRENLKKLKINQIFTKSIFKASIVERFNKTLQTIMYRIFTFQNNKNYNSILNKIVDNYNNTIHSSIKMTPNQVNKKNEKLVAYNLYGDINSETNYIEFYFKKGDYVRLQIDKSIFEKGFTDNWSKEIYIIHRLIPSIPPKYTIKTIENIILNNSFYKQELQKVTHNEFPYDTFELIDTKNNKLEIKKINANYESNKTIIIDKKKYEVAYLDDEKRKALSTESATNEIKKKQEKIEKRFTRSSLNVK